MCREGVTGIDGLFFESRATRRKSVDRLRNTGT